MRPGTKVGRKAVLVETAPEGITSLVTVTATTKAGRRSRLGLSRRKDGGWIVSGTIGVRASRRRLTAVASDPKVVLNAVWGSALARAGISWNRAPYIGAPPEGRPQILAEVASASLDSLASEINRRSLNLGAELLLQWAGGRERAPERLTQHVREVIGSSDGVYLTDGSGLSYDDRVAPSAFISYLAKFPGTAAGLNFPQLLPANGTGTLRRLNTGFPGEGVVRAKTGTLGQVSTVVGYLGGADGVLLVSLMYNGRRPWAARQAQWQLFRDLGADGVVIPTDSTPRAAGADGRRRGRPPGMGGDSPSGGGQRRGPAERWSRGKRTTGRGWTPAAFSTIAARLLRLAGADGHEHDAAHQREAGEQRGIGTDFFSSAVASIGPTSSTFSFLVKEKPPRANPDEPITIRMIPRIDPGFILGGVLGSPE